MPKTLSAILVYLHTQTHTSQLGFKSMGHFSTKLLRVLDK